MIRLDKSARRPAPVWPERLAALIYYHLRTAGDGAAAARLIEKERDSKSIAADRGNVSICYVSICFRSGPPRRMLINLPAGAPSCRWGSLISRAGGPARLEASRRSGRPTRSGRPGDEASSCGRPAAQPDGPHMTHGSRPGAAPTPLERAARFEYSNVRAPASISAGHL